MINRYKRNICTESFIQEYFWRSISLGKFIHMRINLVPGVERLALALYDETIFLDLTLISKKKISSVKQLNFKTRSGIQSFDNSVILRIKLY